MTPGTILGALGFLAAAGNIATYYPKMMSNHATLRPRPEQAIMLLALGLAIASFFLKPGILGAILGILAMVPAGLFLLGTTTSGLPQKPLAIAAGAPAPDIALTDWEGKPFRLWELRGSPVLIKFFRGVWCPYCVAELSQLDRHAADFAARGVKLVAVSSDRLDELQAFKRKNNWAITLLADPELAVHRRYGRVNRNFTPKRGPFRDMALPTTILIGADGRVLWHEQAIDFRVRPQADAVLDQVRRLLADARSAPAEAAACDVCVA